MRNENVCVQMTDWSNKLQWCVFVALLFLFLRNSFSWKLLVNFASHNIWEGHFTGETSVEMYMTDVHIATTSVTFTYEAMCYGKNAWFFLQIGTNYHRVFFLTWCYLWKLLTLILSLLTDWLFSYKDDMMMIWVLLPY